MVVNTHKIRIYFKLLYFVTYNVFVLSSHYFKNELFYIWNMYSMLYIQRTVFETVCFPIHRNDFSEGRIFTRITAIKQRNKTTQDVVFNNNVTLK